MVGKMWAQRKLSTSMRLRTQPHLWAAEISMAWKDGKKGFLKGKKFEKKQLTSMPPLLWDQELAVIPWSRGLDAYHTWPYLHFKLQDKPKEAGFTFWRGNGSFHSQWFAPPNCTVNSQVAAHSKACILDCNRTIGLEYRPPWSGLGSGVMERPFLNCGRSVGHIHPLWADTVV